MLINKAEFLTSLDALKPFEHDDMPQIAMAGKSNVGKSSLINSLCLRNKLARTSSEPGKTRLLNIYMINEELLFVDLPGYGYAKASHQEIDRWGRMIEGYLSGCEALKFVLQLVDIRHEPTRDDVKMVEYLRYYNIPFLVVATKADKLSRAQMQKQVSLICRTLLVQPWEVIPYSSENKYGREKLLDKLDEMLAKYQPREDAGTDDTAGKE